MANTVSFDSLLNTTTGMTAVVNNVKHDDDVVRVTGVDWFTYAGKTASTIYVSGNNFIDCKINIWNIYFCIYICICFVVPVGDICFALLFIDN